MTLLFLITIVGLLLLFTVLIQELFPLLGLWVIKTCRALLTVYGQLIDKGIAEGQVNPRHVHIVAATAHLWVSIAARPIKAADWSRDVILRYKLIRHSLLISDCICMSPSIHGHCSGCIWNHARCLLFLETKSLPIFLAPQQPQRMLWLAKSTLLFGLVAGLGHGHLHVHLGLLLSSNTFIAGGKIGIRVITVLVTLSIILVFKINELGIAK